MDYAQQAADYQAQLDQVRVEILHREDQITAGKESAYRQPVTRELIAGDVRMWTQEIKLLQQQAEVLNKLIARCLQLQSMARG